MKRWRLIFAALLFWFAAAAPALAVRPDEMLSDPKLEARARAISEELRCLVCQNESIDESNADLAHDLRVLVRERLKAGDSDRQVIHYIVARYGQFVLLKPPLEPATYLLWSAPAVIVVLGALGILLYLRTRRPRLAETAPLSEEEEARLRAILDEKDGR